MKIMLFVPHFYFGGVSTVLLHLLRNKPFGIEVLLVVGHSSEDMLKLLDEVDGINYVYLNVKRSGSCFTYLIKLLQSFAPQYAIGVQGHGFFTLFLAALLSGGRIKIIAWEHSTPSKSHVGGSYLKRAVIKYVGRILYRFADKVFVVSEGVKKDFEIYYRVPGKIIKVIKSPILNGETFYQRKISGKTFNQKLRFLYVGRLSKEKCVISILEAFLLVGSTIDWEFNIVGDGPERDNLVKFSVVNNIDNRVFFRGYLSDVENWYLNSDVLLLASEFEGMPTVLIEASAYGLVLVSTDCDSGPREIIVENISGKLVPVDNVREFADALLDVGLNLDGYANSYCIVSGYNAKIASNIFFQSVRDESAINES
jgi:glycosyltransferase involved in cell wall biosynthesis